MSTPRRLVVALVAACVAAAPSVLAADEVTIAVAANFINPLKEIEAAFEASTGHEIRISAASTGQLYAQIRNGAPFDILLSADSERPRLLADDGLGVASSVFTYALGRLALWSAEPERIGDEPLAALVAGRFRWFAIAEPAVAPYGAAARDVLEALGAWDAIQSRLVRPQNVAQTFTTVATRNAELGLVALSQALGYEGPASYRIVPQTLHEPIRQDAILLNRAADNAAAREFLEFLRSEDAAAILVRNGYSTADSSD